MMLVLGACEGEIRAADYDQSCTVDDDCVPVAEGGKCDIEDCGCAFVAINVDDADQYQSDLEALPCTRFGPRAAIACLCVDVVGACNAGTCDVREVPP